MPIDHTPHALATMVTITTYGSWLRGDYRGWIERGGRLRVGAPELRQADRQRMKHSPFQFGEHQLKEVGVMIGDSLIDRLGVSILAFTLDTWHAHFVVGPCRRRIGDVVKCAKDAVRYGLRLGRPIWTDRYDKRWCFDERSVVARVRYVERHNERAGWGPRPWAFITPIEIAIRPGDVCPEERH